MKGRFREQIPGVPVLLENHGMGWRCTCAKGAEGFAHFGPWDQSVQNLRTFRTCALIDEISVSA